MAVVYRALDVRLDRHVALKILAPGLALDEAFRQRFIRESRAAAAVDHPHIIPVFEAGEADGVLFIAMRYVHGGDVRTLLDNGGPLPGDRAAEIIAQVASALDAAHAFGLVHRDVKPANMLLGSTAGSGRQDHVYLSDFGLSKQSLSVTGLTSTGQFLGTLDYVAPEQIEGRQVDGRADLYSLGCAAFEMLCGTPPFRRDQGLAVVWAQLSQDPPSLRERRPEMPAPVDTVLARAMAKSPQDRYPTCLAFAAALREALGLQVSPAGPAGPAGGTPAGGAPAGGAPAGGAAAGRAHPATEVSAPGTDQPGIAAAGAAAGGAGATAAAWQDAGGSPQDAGLPATAGPPTQEVRIPGAGGATQPHGGATQPPGGGDRPGFDRGGQQGGGTGRGRPWWRSPAAIVIACVVVLGAAGGAYAAMRGGKNSGGTAGGGGTAAAVSMPGCSAAIANSTALHSVRTATTHTGGEPFGVTVTADGKYSFITLGNSIAVLSNGAGLAPRLIRTFSAPGASKSATLTSDGKYLIAAANSGAIVINVADAEQGGNPIVGTLTSPYGSGAVEVAISPGDKYVFVTLQKSAAMVVFNLASALASGFGSSDVVGKVTLGQQPVGMAISPDGNLIYATSMARTKTASASEGTVTVVDLHRAEVKPSAAIKSVATAGCSPVRVIISADGKDVWVTSRESDALLGFSAASLLSNPGHSLVARVDVGAAPIGEVMLDQGNRILVANSNLHNQPGASATVSVVSTSAALTGGHALLGVISTGLVPREFGLEPDGKTVLLTNNGTHQVQAIDVSSLP